MSSTLFAGQPGATLVRAANARSRLSMERLRVLMATPFPRPIPRGGIEAAAAQLAHALAAEPTLDLHLAAVHPTVRRPSVERRPGLTLHWLPRWRRLSTLQLLSVAALQLHQLARRLEPDVLHAQGPTGFSLAAQWSARPLVVTIHGLEMFSPGSPSTPALRTFAGPLGRTRRRAATLVMDLQLQRAAATICISPYVEHLLGPRLARTETFRIDNPVDPAFFGLPPAPGGATILSVATIGELKNQLLLVRAFGQVAQQCPASRLVLAGPTADAAYQARVETLITSLGLGARVHLVGQAAPDQLQQLYAKADVVALSSIQETAPLAVAQALAAGRPVVATDVGGLRWLVDDQHTGLLVPSQDTARLASALAALLGDPERRRAMGQRARATAQARFHPAQVAAQTLAVYRHVLQHDAVNQHVLQHGGVDQHVGHPDDDQAEAARCAC